MNKLKLYYDTLSQPSRTLAIFLLTNKIPFESKIVRLGKGEHKTEEFKKISPLQLVPAIDDNGFLLRESVGIARYLCREKDIPNHWYPKESKAQARVDEYLEWQHLGVRLHCGLYFRLMWVEPFFTQKRPNEATAKKYMKLMVNACSQMEDYWVAGDKKFICGNEISLADLFAATELEQPRLCGYDPRNGRPKLTAWFERVKEFTNPHYDEVHLQLNRLTEKFKGECPALIEQKAV